MNCGVASIWKMLKERDMDDLIHGKVARVLNSRHLVINVGAKDGVVRGMKFHIFDPGDDDHGSYTISDPDTLRIIGSVRLAPKRTVTVIAVQDHLSVASTLERRANVGGVNTLVRDMGSLTRALMPPQWITKYETLRRIESDRAVEPIDDSESMVKVRDPAIQVSAIVETASEDSGSVEMKP